MFHASRLVLATSILMLASVAPTPRDFRTPSAVLVVQVADAATNGFIADAQVRLPTIGRIARTRWDGEVQFDNLDNGKYRIEVRAIGYAPGNVDVALIGDTLPVFFSLERVSTTLDTVRVRAERASRTLREFEERRRRKIGRFFTDSALTDNRAKGLQLMLATEVPGMTVAGKTVARGNCRVDFFVDGFQLREVDLDALLIDDFAAMEVYSDVEVPVQYKPMGRPNQPVACTVVLLWTKW
jgi:hypothetical protein